MLKLVKGFLLEEDGMGTVEIVLIIAVLVSVALIFRNTIIDWVRRTVGSVFSGADQGAVTEST